MAMSNNTGRSASIYELARPPRPAPFADRYCIPTIFHFPLPFSLGLCQLPSPFSSPFWATMATLLLQVVLPSDDDLHRGYSVSVFVLSTVVGAFMPLEEAPGKASKVLAPGWLLLDKCHILPSYTKNDAILRSLKPNQIP